MPIMSPKRWFGNMNMKSDCDGTKSTHQKQMTTVLIVLY